MHKDINRLVAKSSYQPNMMLAWVMTIILIVVPMWIFSSLSPSTKDLSDTTFMNIKVIDPSIYTDPELKPTKRNIGGRGKSENLFCGQFIDRDKLKIIPDGNNIITPKIEKPRVYDIDNFDPAVVDHDISVSDIDTGETGMYIPGYADYLFASPVTMGPQSATKKTVNRCPMIIYQEKPAIPPISREMGIGGTVKVLLLLDPEGNPINFAAHLTDSNNGEGRFNLEVTLDGGRQAAVELFVDTNHPEINKYLYLTIKDEPSEFKFAQYLYEVLPRWKFSPAIKNSEPIYCFLCIEYNFCPDKNDNCQDLIISSPFTIY